MKLQNKKIAILIEKLYQELETWYPYYRLKEEGAEVLFVGPEKEKEYIGKHGSPMKAELGIQEVSAKNFDAVIIPGGYAPDYMRRNPEMVKFVKDMQQAGKVVAAICHGGWMLASADVLRGKKATGLSAIQDDMKNAGAEYINEEVVRDGNIITSRTPDDLPAFCRTIIEALVE
ncbi:MAG: type 1 glutamine amidotransferase domain-containing protein [Nanoarchaeota archaeon]|nr:type 1 glutamine amidotransferase domain-containing protein [Nanoarchaeota archaeon]